MISYRVCVVCHAKKLKSEMVRIVKVDKDYVIDPSLKVDGRGAYVCYDPHCIEQMRKRGALKRSFKANVPDDIYDKIEEYVKSQG